MKNIFEIIAKRNMNKLRADEIMSLFALRNIFEMENLCLILKFWYE